MSIRTHRKLCDYAAPPDGKSVHLVNALRCALSRCTYVKHVIRHGLVALRGPVAADATVETSE